MKIDEQKAIKLILTSALVVALVAVKSKLEHSIHEFPALLYFVIFALSLFTLALIEYFFDKIESIDLIEKWLRKRSYIRGSWLNYARDRDSGLIYNFALISIEQEDNSVSVDGQTFRAFKNGDDYHIEHDGHFFSTLAQFNNENSLLGFSFTIDDSEKVRQCKHKIFGSAEYFFERDSGIPRSFSGEFSTENPGIYCNILGHRLSRKKIGTIESRIEKYRQALKYALEKKWIDDAHIPTISKAE